MRLFVWLVTLITFVVSAQATSKICSPSGTDTGAGTLGDPYSISLACTAAALNDRDTVWMRGGHYGPAANFLQTNNDCTFQPRTKITYKNYLSEAPIIRGESTFAALINAVTTTSGEDSVTLDGLEFRWGSKGAIKVIGYVADWTIRNCTFDSTPVPGHTADNESAIGSAHEDDGMTGLLVDSCTFTNTEGRGCIHLYRMDETEIMNSTFTPTNSGGPGGAIFHKQGSLAGHNNKWHHNTFNVTTGSATAMGVLCNGTNSNLRIYNNVVYGDVGLAHVMLSLRCNVSTQDFDSFFVYNNTFDATTTGATKHTILNTRGRNDGESCDMDFFYFFNNIFFLPVDEISVTNLNDSNDGGGGNGGSPFDSVWYSNYNAYVLRTSGDDIYTWFQPDLLADLWDLPGLKANLCDEGVNYQCDSSSISTTDTTDMFTDRGARNYTLNSNGSQYTTLSTGGRGGEWPTYIGAEDPDVSTDHQVTIGGAIEIYDGTIHIIKPEKEER